MNLDGGETPPQRCKRCGGIKTVEHFYMSARGRAGKTCTKCREASARNAKMSRDRKLEERPQNTLPLNSGLSEEELDERLAAVVKKACRITM